SDHGESLGEHGYQYAHGETLYEGGIRVPLVVRFPGVVAAGTRLAGPAMNVDVAPTLLALAGVGGMQSVEGRPLLTLDGTGAARHAVAARTRATVWSETDIAGLHKENPRRFIDGPPGRWTAASDGRFKLIQIPRPGGEILELYDLGADPGELRNLAEDPARQEDRARLYRAIKEFADYGTGVTVPGGAAAEDRERLRALGYFN
ncbi:MAG TPA: sulfatase/phosphatase domain-containing protein, partial [Dongiaceae bacterium]|nr:sulfatase/phosphatase domain-containing protein [Dongiaceae bacterium]